MAAVPRVVADTPPPAFIPCGAVDCLTSDDGSLQVHVGTYADCSGSTALQRDEAALDTCITDRRYFLGHNPGVFTPLMHMPVGTLLTWRDHGGAAHRYRITSERDMSVSESPSPTSASVVAQFQTCVTPDGSVARVFDAVSASQSSNSTPLLSFGSSPTPAP
ncbi:MAG: hypothetical protein ABR564_07770 [Candidatus Dormibacteria bacterium]